MNRTRTALAAGILAAALLSTACGHRDHPGDTVVSDSSGVTILTHHGADAPLDLRFVEDFRLGGSDTRPEESFYRVGQGMASVDHSGRIHVLDPSTHRVVVFDDHGSHLRTVGRSGGGPGEFGMPLGLTVTPAGEIGVADVSKGGFVQFSPEGDILPTLPFPAGYFGGVVHHGPDGMVLPLRRTSGSGPGSDVLALVSGEDTLTLARMDRPEVRPITLESCGMSFSGLAPIFHPTLRWGAGGGRVAVARGADYDIALLEEGRVVRRVRRMVEPRPATMALAVEELGEGMQVTLGDGRQVVCDPREVVEQQGTAPVIPVVGQIAVAPDGGLWVQRGGVRDSPRPVDLFTPEGEYRGTLPEGSPFPIGFFPDGRIAATHTDDFDVVRLVVYRIEEG